MLHPIYFLPTLYTDTDMSIFGMVIVLAFQICILLMGFTGSFSSGPQLYESWHEFPIDLLYKDHLCKLRTFKKNFYCSLT